jgi:hypothetical protein
VQFFVVAMLWLNLLFFLDVWQGIKLGYQDFTIFYTAGKILRQGLGHQLYDRKIQYAVEESITGHIAFRLGPLPYNHPPFEALIFVPLTWLSYQQAFVAWDLLNVAALFGVALLLRRSVGAVRSLPPWKFVLGSLAFFPVFVCLLQGQDSILMLLLCTLAYHALKREADVLGGCWLGLAAFKFQFMVPLLLLLVIWKRRRVVLGFGAVVLVLGLLSAALVGVKPLLQYPGYVLQIANNPGLGGVPPQFLPNFHGLAMGWPPPFSGKLGSALAGLSSVLVFLFAASKGWASPRPGKLELQFSLAILVSVLIAWQTNSHDLSLLTLPFVFLVDHVLRAPRRQGINLLIPTVPLLVSPLWTTLWLVTTRVNLIAIPLLWWTIEIGNELSHANAPDAS